jgi:hypothetical protein
MFVWVFNTTLRPAYPQEMDPVSIVWEARWASGPVRVGAENLVFTGIRSPVRPARSAFRIVNICNSVTDGVCWNVRLNHP